MPSSSVDEPPAPVDIYALSQNRCATGVPFLGGHRERLDVLVVRIADIEFEEVQGTIYSDVTDT